MSLQLAAVRVDATDTAALARFWAGVLGWEVVALDAHEALLRGDAAFALRLVSTDVPKTGRNRLHFDLTSASAHDQAQTVDRALRLGGRHYDVGQRGDEGHVVLADPDGNEFCVIEPENRFLAGCGRIGALNAEGNRPTGVFWSRALGWPLVWDQDEETAIQSPRGGSKITWSGPPLMDKPATGRNRLRLEVAVVGGSLADEAARLVALGAARVDDGGHAVGQAMLTDPDDNELHLVQGADSWHREDRDVRG